MKEKTLMSIFKSFKNTALIIICLIITSTGVFAAADYNTVINQMDYTMTVNEDHSYNIDVHENVTFKGRQHGIYRAFAQSGSYYREVDNKQSEAGYYATITDLKVSSGQPYRTRESGDAFILQIGDPDRYITGQQNYSYSFKYDPGDDGYDSFDDVYFNFLSQYLENPIEHLNLTVTMPKPFNPDEIYFYSGSYGATDQGDLTYSVDGQTITASTTKELSPGTVLSIRIALPDGYFVGARTGEEYLPILYAAAVVSIIISLFAYFLLGRNKKPLEPVMFYPPDDFDPAQVGYVLQNYASNQDLVSLIIYFADKGWLSIENVSPNKDHPIFVFNRLQDIPYDRPDYERTIFNALFAVSDHPTLDSLTSRRSVGNAFITAKEQLKNWFRGERKIMAPSNTTAKIIIGFMMVVTSLIATFNAAYISHASSLTAYLIFFVLALVGPVTTMNANSKKTLIGGIALTAVGAIGIAALTGHIMLGVVVLLMNLLNSYLGHSCGRRTPTGNRWYGETLGFKRFIEMAELDRIKLLVEENPNYYFNILPYAYAMGLTDKWVKNFEGLAIAPPSWYIDPYYGPLDFYRTMYFMSLFNRGITTNMTSIQTEALRRMGSGGFGGGFFGGGFGGGGAGGIGGGSW